MEGKGERHKSKLYTSSINIGDPVVNKILKNFNVVFKIS